MDPLAQHAVALHQRVRVAVGLVVVQDVVADGGICAKVRHRRHLTEALKPRIRLQRLLRVLVPPLLQVAEHDPIEGFLGGGGAGRHAYRPSPGRIVPASSLKRVARKKRGLAQPRVKSKNRGGACSVFFLTYDIRGSHASHQVVETEEAGRKRKVGETWTHKKNVSFPQSPHENAHNTTHTTHKGGGDETEGTVTKLARCRAA